MAKIEEAIHIAAPVEKVFAYLVDPINLPEFWPSFDEVRNVQQMPNGGYCWDWTYKMAGVRFEGRTEHKEFILAQHLVSQSGGSIPSSFTWDFQPEEGGTHLTVQVEYTIPSALLGKLVEPFIVKLNEHEAKTVLANLKTRMET